MRFRPASYTLLTRNKEDSDETLGGVGGSGYGAGSRHGRCAGFSPKHVYDSLQVPGGRGPPPQRRYSVVQKDDSHLTLRQEATGKEFQVPFTKRLAQPSPPLTGPQIVLDVVGNFAPSYTEYVTDYVLAEVWLPGADGFLIHTMKGAHQTQIIKGQKTK